MHRNPGREIPFNYSVAVYDLDSSRIAASLKNVDPRIGVQLYQVNNMPADAENLGKFLGERAYNGAAIPAEYLSQFQEAAHHIPELWEDLGFDFVASPGSSIDGSMVRIGKVGSIDFIAGSAQTPEEAVAVAINAYMAQLARVMKYDVAKGS